MHHCCCRTLVVGPLLVAENWNQDHRLETPPVLQTALYDKILVFSDCITFVCGFASHFRRPIWASQTGLTQSVTINACGISFQSRQSCGIAHSQKSRQEVENTVGTGQVQPKTCVTIKDPAKSYKTLGP